MYPLQRPQNFLLISPPQSPVSFHRQTDSPMSPYVERSQSPLVFFSPMDYFLANVQQMPYEQIFSFLKQHYELIIQETNEDQFSRFLNHFSFCKALNRLFFYEKEPFFQFLEKYHRLQLIDFSPLFFNSLHKVLFLGSSKLRHYLRHPTVTQFICQLPNRELLNIYKDFHGFWWQVSELNSTPLIRLFKIISGTSPTKEAFKTSFELAFFQIDFETQKNILSHPDFAAKIHALFDKEHDRLLSCMRSDIYEALDPSAPPLFAFQSLSSQTRFLSRMVLENFEISPEDELLFRDLYSCKWIQTDKIPFLIVQRPDLFPTNLDSTQIHDCEQIVILAFHRSIQETVHQILFGSQNVVIAKKKEERLKYLGAKALQQIDLSTVHLDEIRRLPIGQFMGLCIQVPALIDGFTQDESIHSMIAKKVDASFERQFHHHKVRLENFFLEFE